jgi:hypothetical protein
MDDRQAFSGLKIQTKTMVSISASRTSPKVPAQ